MARSISLIEQRNENLHMHLDAKNIPPSIHPPYSSTRQFLNEPSTLQIPPSLHPPTPNPDIQPAGSHQKTTRSIHTNNSPKSLNTSPLMIKCTRVRLNNPTCDNRIWAHDQIFESAIQKPDIPSIPLPKSPILTITLKKQDNHPRRGQKCACIAACTIDSLVTMGRHMIGKPGTSG